MKKALVSIALLALSHLSFAQHPLPDIMGLLDQGEIITAQRLLSENLALNTEDVDSRMLLGTILAYTGNPEDAVSTFRHGLSGSQHDYPLYMHIGEARLQQANAEVTLGQASSMLPGASEPAPRHRAEYFRLAEEAFLQAKRLYPYEAEPVQHLAAIYEQLGEYEKAAAEWDFLAYTFPSREDFQVTKALCAIRLQKMAVAKTCLDAALALNPRYAPAYGGLATYWQALGQAAASQQAQKQQDYFSWLPTFVRLPFDEANFARYQQMSDLDDEPGRTALVASLINDKSLAATQWLTVALWHRTTEVAAEDIVLEELGYRGLTGAKMLMEVARQAEEEIIVGKASRKLTELRVPGTYDLLVQLLPRDRDLYSSMNIAYQMAVLGDERSITHLLNELFPVYGEALAEDHDSMALSDEGLLAARNRAALALAFFDHPAVVAKLRQGLHDRHVRQSCAAALYRLTLDENYLAQMRKNLEEQESKNADIAAFLRIIGTKKAVALAERLD
ncbi:MAG: hypothetical protein MUC97_03035 [Bernardetiaceae bacterium]|jgi:tetratricopeptide (TPR) repeat protein|nr:hypothetical protein [Bernardetiaceae bacterium]